MNSTTTMTDAAPPVTLALEPLDVLFFRDGRPFGEATRAQSGLPTPQVLCGAVQNWLLRQAGCCFRTLEQTVQQGGCFEEAVEKGGAPGWIAHVRTRGPWLAQWESGARRVLVPAPATLHQEKHPAEQSSATLFRLDPLGPREILPGWQPPLDGMRPLWLRNPARTERAAGYLTLQGMKAYLGGGVPEKSDLVSADELYGFDLRTGIEIDAKRLIAAESMLYAASFLTLKPGVKFVAEVLLPPDAPAEVLSGELTIAFGGERKQVYARKTEPIGWSQPPGASHGRTLLVLTTPGIFEHGWQPSRLNGSVKLVAAAVPGYEAVSGWDLARNGPKRTRFAVPAGSVFFVEGELPAMAGDSLADDAEDSRQGWGCFVTGTWSDP